MKYMIMLYGSQQFYDMMAGKPTDGPVMTAEELEAMHTYMGEFHQKLVESGELVDAQVLGAVVRRYGNFDAADDAVQEALLAAATQWPVEGVPDDPRAWLITVASRRLTDILRRAQARRRREDEVAAWVLPEQHLAPSADRPAADSDDTLILLFMCCHPSLTPESQIALTLRTVDGLATAEVARAFLVPEATRARSIRAESRMRHGALGEQL